MSGWYLEEISIEGFRGVNNEGAPLSLKLKPDCVNSICAPNGIGKSSIFEATVYAITGRIPKLEALPAVEQGPSYYLNRFHAGGLGMVALTVVPAGGGASVTVTVTRDVNGNRSVQATAGADGEAILAELNHEFVLLDGKTFRDFIDEKPLERGRSFAGLLGLKRYSEVRQALLGLSNTVFFNNHFGIASKNTAKSTAAATAQRATANIKEAYMVLVDEDFDPAFTEQQVLQRAHSALNGIELLKPLCDGKGFLEIDPNACVQAAKVAEGGEDRERFSRLVRRETEWNEARQLAPNLEDGERLIELADARDAALAQTQGDLFRQLYVLSQKILTDDKWVDKSVCPACDRSGPNSVLDHVKTKIAAFDAVGKASSDLALEWGQKGWGQLSKLEALALEDGESPALAGASVTASSGSLQGEQTRKIVAWVKTLFERSTKALQSIAEQKVQLEKTLPPLLTAVVEKAEAARRLQTNLNELKQAEAKHAEI